VSVSLGTAYVAGPMRGCLDFNFPSFQIAAAALRRVGWTVLSPAERDLAEGFDPTLNTLEGFDVEAAMADDFAMILEADAIVLLPGWEQSKGARAERFVAEKVGKHVLRFSVESSTHTELADPWDGNPHLPATHTTETRITDPVTGGQKGAKLARFDLLPWDVLWTVAELYGVGAAKYEDRNWEKSYPFSLSIAALGRHFAQFARGEDVDSETGLPHLASVVFHACALIRFCNEHPEQDDRSGRS
jgi:hypothetical protein